MFYIPDMNQASTRHTVKKAGIVRIYAINKKQIYFYDKNKQEENKDNEQTREG